MAPNVDKTFTDPDGDELNVSTYARYEEGQVVSVHVKDNGTRAGSKFHLRKTDAPAAALAILEAAGYKANRPFEGGILTEAGQAMYLLGRVVADAERTAAKAADEAKLNAEALQLVNAARGAAQRSPRAALEEIAEPDRSYWRAVARAAREIHADKEAK